MTEDSAPKQHPEVGALLDELIAAGRPSSRTLPLPDGRRNFDEMIDPLTDYPEVGAVEDRTIPVPTPDPAPVTKAIFIFPGSPGRSQTRFFGYQGTSTGR